MRAYEYMLITHGLRPYKGFISFMLEGKSVTNTWYVMAIDEVSAAEALREQLDHSDLSGRVHGVMPLVPKECNLLWEMPPGAHELDVSPFSTHGAGAYQQQVNAALQDLIHLRQRNRDKKGDKS
jgi:hypothetical protein